MHEYNLEWKWEMDGSLRFFCKKKKIREPKQESLTRDLYEKVN